MNTNEIVLIDLSSIAYPIWHVTQSEPDPNRASQQIVERVRALASGHAKVAICCDAGRSFRRDLAPSYKANRPDTDAPLQHQITLAREALAADGFPVWMAPGFEADDIIATATAKALATPDATVLIVSADKDLLQLVGPRVEAMSVSNGTRYNAEAVGVKFGVRPEQMRDYLTLVGDASDNVKGAKGIGGKRAAELLAKGGTLDQLYRDLAEVGGAALGLTPSIVAALREFQPSLDLTRQLITLRTDAPVAFEQITAERQAAPASLIEQFDVETDDAPEPAPAAPRLVTSMPAPSSDQLTSADTKTDKSGETQALAVRDAEVMPAPAEWERQLDPRTMKDARVLAKDMYDSRMFSAYGTPQAVLSTVMVGRELGLPAMASLRGVHIIEGKHALSAALMVALVLRSGLAEYFEPVEFTDTAATFETKRKGARNPVKLTHTIEMARTAWAKTADAWAKSGWGHNPTDMLVARAQARLCRMVYPDLLAGLYTPEELEDIRQQAVA